MIETQIPEPRVYIPSQSVVFNPDEKMTDHFQKISKDNGKTYQVLVASVNTTYSFPFSQHTAKKIADEQINWVLIRSFKRKDKTLYHFDLYSSLEKIKVNSDLFAERLTDNLEKMIRTIHKRVKSHEEFVQDCIIMQEYGQS